MLRLTDLHRDGPPPLPAADWQRSRPEILRRWLEVLGDLPPAIEPTFRILDTARQGTHRRLRISFPTGDGDQVVALLLIPDTVLGGAARTGAAPDVGRR